MAESSQVVYRAFARNCGCSLPGLSLVLATLACATPVMAQNNALVLAERQRGVSWVGSGAITEADLKPLVESHVNWIAQTPFGWQQKYDSPEIAMSRGRRVRWGERDEGLRTTTRLARKHGIRTLLKPHIWLRGRSDGKWRSDIAMRSEADWQKWFEDYRTFILHYARLAQEIGIEALSIGAELHQTVKQRPDEWRRIIREVREVYSGLVTYSANWYEEFEDVTFWEELDLIGIQAYFPLTDKLHPSVADLKQGWQRHLEKIEAMHLRYDIPILFTEIGYKNTLDSAAKPWEWRGETGPETAARDLQLQADCYEAFFQTFWDKDWFAGAHFWKWFPGRRLNSGRRVDQFTPQNKPAQEVLANWFSREAHHRLPAVQSGQ